MEVLLDHVCLLCEEVTAILSPKSVEPYIKYLYSTYFDKNKNAMHQFQANALHGGMCVLCSHQVVIAHKFKDSYEDICKKTSGHKKNRLGCLLCEQKGVDLISTDRNPNGFCEKISTYMETTLFPIPYAQSMVCFDCIFYLNVWHRIFVHVQKKCYTKLSENTPEAVTRTKAQKKVHFHEPHTVIEIDAPRESTSKVQYQAARKGSPPPKLKRSHKYKAGPLSTKRKGFKRNKATFKKELKKQLKHLKSIKQVNTRKRWSPHILKNQKMYADVPYVLVTRDQIKNHARERSKSPELIEIYDSDEDQEQSKPSKAKRGYHFKIRMSDKFLSKPKPNSKKRKIELDHYTCSICDKIFTSLAEYKTHDLWHTKPERLRINVTRFNFTNQEDIHKAINSLRNTSQGEDHTENAEVENSADSDTDIFKMKDEDHVKVTFQDLIDQETERTDNNKETGDNSADYDMSNSEKKDENPVKVTEETNVDEDKIATGEVNKDLSNDENGENVQAVENNLEDNSNISAEKTMETETDKDDSKIIDEGNTGAELTSELQMDVGSEETKQLDAVNSITDKCGEEDDKNENDHGVNETDSIHNNKSNDFSSDSEIGDSVLETSLKELIRDEGNNEGNTCLTELAREKGGDEGNAEEELGTCKQNNAHYTEELILNKKCSHNGSIHEDGCSIIENGNDSTQQFTSD